MPAHDSRSPRAARVITSLQNEQVKAIRALDMRKVRRETELFVAEGVSILASARERGIVPETLVMLAGAAEAGMAVTLAGWALEAGADVLEVSPPVMAKIAARDNPQTMLGVFRQRFAAPPDAAAVGANATWVALEEIRDPGNLGTIVRTVDAVGAAGVILVGTCCDPYAREAVRATMGSIFAVPLARMTGEEFLSWRARWPGDVIGTHLAAQDDMRRVTYREPVLLMMGGEGPGLSPALADAATRLVKIPMAGRLDSLNLAVATALTLYQIRSPHLSLS